MDLVKAALEIATRAHAGVLDKGGVPYILHPIAVAEGVAHRGAEVEAAALLHDVVEDTAVTLEDLKRMGMPDRVLVLVEGMTHRKGHETYFEYIGRIIATDDPDLMLIKLSDVRHNTKLDRGDYTPPASLLDRYAKTRTKIEAALTTLGVVI